MDTAYCWVNYPLIKSLLFWKIKRKHFMHCDQTQYPEHTDKKLVPLSRMTTMKNTLSLVITVLFLLNNAYGVAYFDGFPSETILLKFPENETHWREVYRRIDAEKLQVDFISYEQPISNSLQM